jgi:hypothetical protein
VDAIVIKKILKPQLCRNDEIKSLNWMQESFIGNDVSSKDRQINQEGSDDEAHF